jgi:ArsR family transcriptional regulator, repressor of sdpIR and other operons
MSGHFAVLRAADLIVADKQGTTITYSLRLSVLEDALLWFADKFGVGMSPAAPNVGHSKRHRHAT